MKIFLLALLTLSSSAFAGGTIGGVGPAKEDENLSISKEIVPGELGPFIDLEAKEFSDVVKESLTDRPIVINSEIMKADQLDFRSKVILMRSVTDPKKEIFLQVGLSREVIELRSDGRQ